jgi:general secretion pathway protein G
MDKTRKRSKLAIVSLVLGICSFVPLLGYVFGIVAVITGIIALIICLSNKETVRGAKMAAAGIVLGGLFGMFLFPILLGRVATKLEPKLEQKITESKIGSTQARIRAIEASLNIYKFDSGVYPTQKQGLDALVNKPTLPPVPSKWKQVVDNPGLIKDAWGNDLVYVIPGIHNLKGYDLFSKGPDGMGDGTGADDINNWKKN